MHALELANAMLFLSTLSLRRATGRITLNGTKKLNFYPRSPCGERLPSVLHSFRPLQISIHALLAESDGVHYDNYNLHCVISIHALLAESDVTTRGNHRRIRPISIHALLAESDVQIIVVVMHALISIHALLAESDAGVCIRSRTLIVFLSTLSLRRATRHPETLRQNQCRFLSTLSLRRATCQGVHCRGCP